MARLTPREIALHVARIAWEKDGQDLRVLAFPAGSQVFDFCVVVTGRSDRQVRAIADEASQFAKRTGLHRHPVEGDSGWILLDLGDVVLHAFTAERRKLYSLDNLWPRVTFVDYEAGFRRLPPMDTGTATQPSAHS